MSINSYQAILVLVESSIGYVIIQRLPNGKKVKELAQEAGLLVLAYPSWGVMTITTDKGSEFSRHELIIKALKGVDVYFADPYCACQKGMEKYTNKFI